MVRGRFGSSRCCCEGGGGGGGGGGGSGACECRSMTSPDMVGVNFSTAAIARYRWASSALAQEERESGFTFITHRLPQPDTDVISAGDASNGNTIFRLGLDSSDCGGSELWSSSGNANETTVNNMELLSTAGQAATLSSNDGSTAGGNLRTRSWLRMPVPRDESWSTAHDIDDGSVVSQSTFGLTDYIAQMVRDKDTDDLYAIQGDVSSLGNLEWPVMDLVTIDPGGGVTDSFDGDDSDGHAFSTIAARNGKVAVRNFVFNAISNAFIEERVEVYDSGFNLSWSYTVPTGRFRPGAFDSSGNLYCVTIPGSGPKITKFDDAGNVLWQDPMPFEVVSIEVDDAGNVYAYGHSLGGGNDAMYVKSYSPDGTLRWSFVATNTTPFGSGTSWCRPSHMFVEDTDLLILSTRRAVGFDNGP